MFPSLLSWEGGSGEKCRRSNSLVIAVFCVDDVRRYYHQGVCVDAGEYWRMNRCCSTSSVALHALQGRFTFTVTRRLHMAVVLHVWRKTRRSSTWVITEHTTLQEDQRGAALNVLYVCHSIHPAGIWWDPRWRTKWAKISWTLLASNYPFIKYRAIIGDIGGDVQRFRGDGGGCDVFGGCVVLMWMIREHLKHTTWEHTIIKHRW